MHTDCVTSNFHGKVYAYYDLKEDAKNSRPIDFFFISQIKDVFFSLKKKKDIEFN